MLNTGDDDDDFCIDDDECHLGDDDDYDLKERSFYNLRDDNYCFKDDYGEYHRGTDDNPETFINWMHEPDGTNIPNGGTTTSTRVIVDFQGSVEGRGSHIET
jgi:hypothetical protein